MSVFQRLAAAAAPAATKVDWKAPVPTPAERAEAERQEYLRDKRKRREDRREEKEKRRKTEASPPPAPAPAKADSSPPSATAPDPFATQSRPAAPPPPGCPFAGLHPVEAPAAAPAPTAPAPPAPAAPPPVYEPPQMLTDDAALAAENFRIAQQQRERAAHQKQQHRDNFTQRLMQQQLAHLTKRQPVTGGRVVAGEMIGGAADILSGRRPLPGRPPGDLALVTSDTPLPRRDHTTYCGGRTTEVPSSHQAPQLVPRLMPMIDPLTVQTMQSAPRYCHDPSQDPQPITGVDRIKARITELYRAYRPHQVGLLPNLFIKYAGREQDVLDKAEKLFGGEIKAQGFAVGDWPCPKCKRVNWKARDECHQCGTKKGWVEKRDAKKTPDGSAGSMAAAAALYGQYTAAAAADGDAAGGGGRRKGKERNAEA